MKYDIPINRFPSCTAAEFEETEGERLAALNHFWADVPDAPVPFSRAETAYAWMYDHLISYRPFYEMIRQCRGEAISLLELARSIFPETAEEDALAAVSVLLVIIPLARNEKSAVLFPARMHMLFKGIKGVYACANQECPHSHTGGGLTLGEIFLTDKDLVCPECGCAIYELYNDRRCGALFFKGYIIEGVYNADGSTYLWRYPGQIIDPHMREVHLYLQPEGAPPVKRHGKNTIKPCYLDVRTAGQPKIHTWRQCPHCDYPLSSTQLTSFSTRGNQSFFNLIKTQFQEQPPVPGKDQDPVHLPNQGRKVLLFSDSRQKAARLARDMSEASDDTAVRQLFALAISEMEYAVNEASMDQFYGYFVLAAARQDLRIFHEPDRSKFAGDCEKVKKDHERKARRGKTYTPDLTLNNAPVQMQEALLRMFYGGYNTLYDSAVSWLEPTEDALDNTLEGLEEQGLAVSDEEFLELFNAWIVSICDKATALGHTINDSVRKEVRPLYGGYGLDKDWDFSENI